LPRRPIVMRPTYSIACITEPPKTTHLE